MADVFAEIDDAMRQERLEKLWKEYGSVLVTFLVVLILGTAAISGYRAWNTGVQEKQTGVILNYIQPGANNPEEFAKASEDMRAGLRGLSLLIAAGQALDNDNQQLALSIYQNAASDKKLPVTFRDLAVLMEVRLMAAQGSSESNDAAELLNKLNPVWSNSKSPWNAYARLEAAMLEAHLNENYEAAQEHLSLIIAADNVPQAVHQRAKALSHVYALRQTENKG